MTASVNRIAEFLAFDNWDGQPVEFLILLGNSVVETACWAAQALLDGFAEKILIAGGIGHATEYLVRSVQSGEFSDIPTEARTEAAILRDLVVRCGVDPALILTEERSTNCGENASEALRVLGDQIPRSVLLVQDPTMQLRTWASFLHEWKDVPATLYSHAVFVPQLVKGVVEPQTAKGIWPLDRFLSLLSGEIPRLRDDIHGYGPKGRAYIAHVDIPSEIESAYSELMKTLGARRN